jgi:hypothetical protein
MSKVYVMLGLLVVLGAVAWFVNYDPTGKGHDRAPAKEVSETSRLPAIDQGRVHAIEISDPENRVRVARSGEKWVLPEKFNAPAVDQRANDLLKGLSGLEKSERVSKSAASARDKAYGLEPEAAKRLKLFDENNKVIADLWVGKPDMGGERTVQLAGNFVRMEGSDAVYTHKQRLQHLVMPQLSMWLEGRLFALDPKELEDTVTKAERVTVEFDDAPFTPGSPDPESRGTETSPVARVRVALEGKAPETRAESPPTDIGPKPATPAKPTPKPSRDWTLVEPAGHDVKPYGPFVDQIIRGLLYGRADDVVGSDPTLAEYGFARPLVEVEVRFSDGTTRRLRIGNHAKAPTEPTRKAGSYRYAHVDGVPRVFVINDYVVAQYRKKPEELKQPEPRTPGAGVQAPIELPKDGAESRK